MQEVQSTNEKIGNSNNMQVFVVLHFPRIPSNNKYGESYYNRKELDQRMEEHVAMFLAVNKNQHQANDTKCGTVVAVEKRSECSQGYELSLRQIYALGSVMKITLKAKISSAAQ